MYQSANVPSSTKAQQVPCRGLNDVIGSSTPPPRLSLMDHINTTESFASQIHQSLDELEQRLTVLMYPRGPKAPADKPQSFEIIQAPSPVQERIKQIQDVLGMVNLRIKEIINNLDV